MPTRPDAVRGAPTGQNAEPVAPDAERSQPGLLWRLDLERFVPVIGLVSIPLLVTVRTLTPLADPDVLWHLLLGRKLLATWNFGTVDPLSSVTTIPWTYNQWLPEIAEAWADSWGGLAAVAWLWVAFRLGLLAVLWVVCRRRASGLPALLATVVAFVGAYGALGPRPQVVGLILLAVTVGAWLRSADDAKPRWWLIGLAWLWACTHGTWLIGVALGAAVAVGIALDHKQLPWRQRLVPLAVPLGSVLAAAITPVGPRLLLVPGLVAQVSSFITEWQPASLKEPLALVTAAGLAVVALVWLRRPDARPSWSRIALFGVAAVSTFLYMRTIAIGAIIMGPLLAEALQRLIPKPYRPRARSELVALAVGCALTLAYAGVVLPTTARTPSKVPAALGAQLAQEPAQRIVNEETLGGWLMWAYPQLTPMIDTRFEVYGRDYTQNYLRVLYAQAGWEQIFEGYGARLVLIDEDSALGAALVAQRGWVELGRDAGYLLLKAPA